MRRNLIIAALLTSTALVSPQKAAADPVTAFVGGFLNALGAGTFLASSSFVGAWSAGFAVGGFLGTTIVGRLLVSIGLSYLSAALAPRPDIPPQSARMANFAQPVSYAEWVLGRTRKGGPLGFTGFTDHTDVVTASTGKKRHYSPILAAHPIKGVVTHYLDDREVEVDANGLVITPPMAGYYRIRPFIGAQMADPELVAAFTEITSAHDFAGLSGAHVWAKRPPQAEFTEIYPTGRQGAYTPVIDGHNEVYDPRDDTYKFTRNAALILAFWITKILGQQVDWDEVAVEADVSDELVTNRDGGTQPRWRLDGTISDDMEFEQQRTQLAAACDAFLYERPDGKVGFKVGSWIEPEHTLTQADFYSMELSQGTWGSGAPTAVAAIYTEPANNWRESPSGEYEIETGEREVRDTPQLPFVSSHNQAWRMNVRLAKTKRPKYQLQGTVGLLGYSLQAERFIRVTNPEMGVDEYFEIGELYRNEGGMSFNIVANSVEPADFSPDALANEPARPEIKKVVSDDTVETVGGLLGAAVDGGSIDWSWDAQDASLTQQLQMRVSGSSDWQIISIPAGQEFYLATGLVDGVTYEAQVRNRTSASRVSDWKPNAPLTVKVVANSVAPAVATSLVVSLVGSDVHVTFGAPNDPNYHAMRIHRALNSTVFTNATLVRTEYGVPSNSDTWVDSGPSSGDQSYWVQTINASGVAGPVLGPQTVTVP